jgi:hypothetical protein
MYYYITTIFLILLFAYISIVVMYNPPALAGFAMEQQQLLVLSQEEILEKHWVHSYEEDKDDIQVYHPSTFNFPLSRGRMGFEIQKNGTFIQYGIGPDDRQKKIEGNWTIEEEEEPNTIKIDFATDKAIKSYNMKIISYGNNTLVIKKY